MIITANFVTHVCDCRQQYLQHIRSMYNPDYKLGLQRTLEAERGRNNILKRTSAVMQSEVSDLNADGEGNYHIHRAAILSIPMTTLYM